MDYELHYTRLINRARNRDTSTILCEKHHILPKCIGGTDDHTNLVKLTPEEHYVAHQLLTKMFPGNHKLLFAAAMMICGRPSNKLYGWLKRKRSAYMANCCRGSQSSQFGKCWIFNLDKKQSKSVMLVDFPAWKEQGWLRGRVTNFEVVHDCVICGKLVLRKHKTCGNRECLRKLASNNQQKNSPLFGREDEFILLYQQNKSINKSLQTMGFPGNNAHWGKHARKILTKINGSNLPLENSQ